MPEADSNEQRLVNELDSFLRTATGNPSLQRACTHARALRSALVDAPEFADNPVGEYYGRQTEGR